MAWSKSTRSPANSGPSTQANWTLPPTMTRQAPHMPVPSTMMGFRLTMLGMPSFRVSMQANFIMIMGPMTMA